MEIWEYLLLFFSVIIGGGLAFYIKNYNPKILQRLLSFVGAYILGITVLHLLPDVYEGHSHSIGLWVLGGFCVQLILELVSGGVEHGHVHPIHEPKLGFALQILIGLCIHAFIEGMPLEVYESYHETTQHNHDHQHLLYGIILHKIPAAFVLVFLLNLSGYKKTSIWMLLVFFALMSPFGAYSAGALVKVGVLTVENEQILLAIVVGSFLHIATTILFETETKEHHHVSVNKIIMILLGLVLALFTVHW